ncbi:peroxide stress protein YaaA [Undibacterium sp. Ji22W]|uniref:peroxide stress protein YaaA n=1 Tax=Undibacterium sp. Ji22W TaxID=3413038 RepID=UPI003BF3BC0C
MLILLSPAKSLDFTTPAVVKSSTQIQFSQEVDYLAGIASQLSSSDLQRMMKISPELALLNVERFAQLTNASKEKIERQAVFMFDGDVYSGLQARLMSKKEINYLQKNLRILSGLYGLLRPLDMINAYRLEMGTGLKTAAGNNLYAYWSEKLTASVIRELEQTKSKFLVNLASEEYAKAIKLKSLPVPVIQPVFQDYSAGKFKVVSFFAKKARGSMVRYCATNQIKKAADLKKFNDDGYVYVEEESDACHWIFRRKMAV